MAGVKYVIGALVAVAGAIALPSGSALAQDAGEEVTIYSGVYTEEQAERGRSAYSANCAVCHGPTGRGGPDAPGVIGHVLNRKYEGAPLVAYFEYMRARMPLGRPNSLPRETYADITAFLLANHGAPAGEVELPSDEDALAEIQITTEPE